MRIQPLSTANAGMTRLRSKGNAAPNTLYDLLNGYITLSGTIKPRPGSQTDITLPANTKGLVAHKCRLYVFSHTPQVTSNPDKYVVATLRHPIDSTIALEQIHFAAPFMGFLYVAAEFADGNTWHYWLEELDTWSANTDYMIGQRVFPTTENGFAYQANRTGSPYPNWTADTEYSVNDVIEPATYNGFKYTVVSATGTTPRSGSVEPDWPAEAGAQIVEYAEGQEAAVVSTTVINPDTQFYYGGFLSGYDPNLLAGGFRGGTSTIRQP